MENIILILGKDSIEVNKEKLANKSHYFASLFSHNFSDSHEKEHVINYNIDLSTLQIFIKWIEDDAERIDPDCYSIKSSMTQFVSNDFKELLNLLQLSVLYMVEELTDDIIHIIVLFWLMPEKIIDIWLLAEELNVKVLQDICLSECLDHFKELPLHLLVQLTKDKICQLLLNINVRSSTEYLQLVRQEWMQHNMITDMPKIEIERQPKFMQGIVVYKIQEHISKHDVFLYTWNNHVFSKCTQVKTIHCTQKGVVGMQVVGRGFSMYAVGGECGLGTGHFNKTIWRYCLISEKWYYKAKLRVPRRHMVAAFLGNKLVVAGGVGTHRLKLHTVDILDIHTGEWKEGAEVPESFTDIPPHCVMDGKLFFMKSLLYIYDPKDNHWRSLRVYSTPSFYTVDVFLAQNTTTFLLGMHLKDTVISRINLVKDSVCEKEECLKQSLGHSVINSANIVFEKDSYEIRYVQVYGTGILLLSNRLSDKQYLHVHTEIKRDFEPFTIPRTGCFNIIDPDALYNTV